MEGDADFRPWNELIPDVLGLIFSKLIGREILRAIPLVCKSWCEVVKGPYCWEKIDTYCFLQSTALHDKVKVEQVLRALIPRSSDSLRELYVLCIDDHMLSYIAGHAGSLETLDIGFSLMNESTFEQFATELGSLTTLVIRSNHGMSQRTLEAISKNCKRLESLSWQNDGNVLISEVLSWQNDGDVLISEVLSYDEDNCFECSMPKLKHLTLRYSLLECSYLFSLLSGSPELESVEIRGLNLDPRVVKEKYPNIVTLVLDNVLDSWDDIFETDSDDSYDDEGLLADFDYWRF